MEENIGLLKEEYRTGSKSESILEGVFELVVAVIFAIVGISLLLSAITFLTEIEVLEILAFLNITTLPSMIFLLLLVGTVILVIIAGILGIIEAGILAISGLHQIQLIK